MGVMGVIRPRQQPVDIVSSCIKTSCIQIYDSLSIRAEVITMTATTKSDVLQAHEAMAAVLDARFGNVPEWKAFRAIDRALIAEIERGAANAMPAVLPTPPAQHRERLRLILPDQLNSYNALTDLALQERGKPIPTPQLMEFIGARRKLDPDPDKAKITVTSTLSKHPRYRSVPWEGGRAWWYADRPVPKNESAG
jgi:hypothetical protein